MMQSEEEIFATFRPYCSALATKPSPAILARLKEVVVHTNSTQLGQIQEYIMFPMQLYLRTPTLPENYTLQVMEFVSVFFAKTTLASTFVFKDLMSSCLTMSMSTKDKISEDFKLSFCKLIRTLVTSADPDVKMYIYSEDLKLPLSHIIFECLEWAETDSARNVVISSLQVLDAVIVEANNDDNASLQRAFAERFAQMVPGTATKLVKVLRRNFEAQSHKIKALCLVLWMKSVVSVLNDTHVNEDPINLETSADDKVAILCDPQWVGKAQDHLLQHMQIFATMTVHPQLLVREALQTLCQSFLSHSVQTFRNTHALQVSYYYITFFVA
jgi:hypothetical protein